MARAGRCRCRPGRVQAGCRVSARGSPPLDRAPVNLSTARRLALSLPDASEEDHHGRPSFRVRGRIFATVPDQEHLNIFIEPMDVDGVVRLDPDVFAPVMWGQEVRGVRVHLPRASSGMVRDLLTAAWRRKAPKRGR
ncbi:MAG: MmcQ/YjbR family DNA-binding protein [Chloroflexi bacterium]|nr:MAG: MmcQ/YjbR family DNA-binding protein [Chloroflexota bacterium]